MDVDKLFKLPKVPQSSLNKRKWSEPTNATLQSYKIRDDANGESSESGLVDDIPLRGSKAARVSHDEDNEDGDDFAPGNDADYFIDEDDDGGRFFGGGLTSQQKRILEIMNGAEEDGDEAGPKAEEQVKSFRRSLLRLERTINKNQEMRVRFSDDPSKYIESEADLDTAIKALVVATTNPPLYYPDMIKHGCSASLCSLLSHENVDIAASVTEILEEMTDDDVLDAGEEIRTQAEQETRQRKGDECMRELVESLLEQSLVDLLVQNLLRLNDDVSEQEKMSDRSSLLVSSDSSAIYHLLGLIENLVSLQSSLAVTFLSDKSLPDWLLNRITRKSSFDQNKAYAGELLGILMQVASSSTDNRDECMRLFGHRGGIGKALEVLANFRKREPKDDEEGEFMENIVDVLCTAMTLGENKQIFHQEEGTELMCILLKSKGLVQLRAIKVLNHALSGPFGSVNCVTFVDSQGLKPLFAVLMGKGKGKHAEATSQDYEHIFEIIMSLLNNLKSESIERIRLISKFVEREYEKVDRLLEVRSTIRARLKPIEEDLKEQRKGENGSLEEDAQLYSYIERVEHGLFSLQLIDYTLAWLIMEDDGILTHIKMLFSRTNDSLDDIVSTLKEYHENVGDDAFVSLPSPNEKDEDGEGLRLKDVIVNLVNYVLAIRS